MVDAEKLRTAKPGWVRLLVEAVDVPLTADSSLFFSTVQSVVPGAHGLYYRGVDGGRKALTFDQSGHVRAPEAGWYENDIFIHLAHGHRHGSHSADSSSYTRATEQFERNVGLVQKLIASAGLTAQLPKHHADTKKRSARSTPASEPILAESSSRSESDDENALKQLRADNNDLIERLTEAQTELQKLKNSQRHEPSSSPEAESGEIKMLRERLQTTEDRLEEAERLAEHSSRRATQCEREEENALKKACASEKAAVEERERAEKAEWALGEHRAWLEQSRARVAEQDAQLNDANNRLHEAWGCVADRDGEIKKLYESLDEIRWSLGENVQWLGDAKARTAELERERDEVATKVASLESEVNCLRAEKEEALKEVTHELVHLNKETVALQQTANVDEEEMFVKKDVRMDESGLFGAEEKYDELERAVDELRAEVEELQKAREAREHEIVEMQRSSSQAMAEAETRLAAAEAALAERAAELEEERARTAHLSEELSNRIDALNFVNGEATALREEAAAAAEREARLQQEAAANAEIAAELHAVKGEAAKAEWKLGEHRAWLHQAIQRKEELEESLCGAHEEIRRLKEQSETPTQDTGKVIALEEELNQARGELERLKEKEQRAVADQAERVSAAEAAAAEAREKLAAAEWSLGEHREWLQQAKGRAEQLEREVDDIRREAEDLKEHLAVARLEKEALAIELGAAKEEEEKMQAVFLQPRQASVEAGPAERIAELESELETTRHSLEEEMERRVTELSQRCEKASAELADAKRRIQELTDKEEEVNNLHAVITELREKLREAEQKNSQAEWHLGEHREWLKNEKDKVQYLEEQLRRNPESSNSRVASRKNSSESGLGSSIIESTVDASAGRESPPAAPAKFKFSSNSDDLATELMALSRDKQRLAAEIRELKTRPDPAIIEAERRAHSEAIWLANEKCARLENETAHYKDVAAHVNLDVFEANEKRIVDLENEKANLEWRLGESGRALDDAKWRIGELEAECGRLLSHSAATDIVHEKERVIRELSSQKEALEWKAGELTQAWNDAKWRIGELSAELSAARQTPTGGQSDEAINGLLQEKAALEARCAQLQSDWHAHKWRIGELESGYAHHEWMLSQQPSREEVEKVYGEKRHLEWQLGEIQKAADDAKWRVGELEAEVARTKEEREAEKGGQLEEALRALRGEKEHLEWRVGELTKAFNDTKWRCGELEAALAHHKWLLEDSRAQNSQLAQNEAAAQPQLHRDGTFIVKNRNADANFWELGATTNEDSTCELRRVPIAIDVPEDTDTVFLIGSFVNWECSTRLARISSEGRREVVLHLPPGIYEFRFVVEGGWRSSAHYPTVPNPFGTTNNIITVS